jgi:hypothetical protein
MMIWRSEVATTNLCPAADMLYAFPGLQPFPGAQCMALRAFKGNGDNALNSSLQESSQWPRFCMLPRDMALQAVCYPLVLTPYAFIGRAVTIADLHLFSQRRFQFKLANQSSLLDPIKLYGQVDCNRRKLQWSNCSTREQWHQQFHSFFGKSLLCLAQSCQFHSVCRR